jgi:hypothetical protein
MKHLKKFNESESNHQVTDEEKEIITKLEKLMDSSIITCP